jgi:predicted amidohydrolase
MLRIFAFRKMVVPVFLLCLLWTSGRSQSVRIACAQIGYGTDTSKSIADIIKAVNQAADSGADIVLTPEVMMTCWKFGAAIPQSWVNAKLALISQECLKRNIAAVVSGNRVDDSGKVYLTGYLIDRSGRLVGWYDKTGLLFDEISAGFSKGMSYPVFDLDINGRMVKVGLQICRDQQYFAGFRLLALKGAQIILHIAAGLSNPELPGERRQIEAKLRERAVTNSVILASINQVADSGFYQLMRSQLIDPRGVVLNKTPDGNEHMICATFDLSLADHSMLNQRRTDLYDIKEK